jgi:1-acyl-sn-glycerol-3-phosphate acyltransferase
MDRLSISPTSGPVIPTSRRGSLGYRVMKMTLGRAVRVVFRVKVDGLEQVPDQGPVILAANHLSFMDSIFLAVTSPRPIAFMAKAEYFNQRFTRWLFTATGQIPLRRGSPASARRALAAASDVLRRDGTVGIFPEGTRSRDGRLHRGHRGPALLAIDAHVPIVPVGLIGTDKVQQPDQRLPRPFKTVHVHYGAPRHPDRFNSEVSRVARVRDVTDTMMRDIATLSGQRYVDEYSPIARAHA